ncbi:MAG: 2-hydroxyacyl-CoA dehydratase [Deltaproteobacteria bacterium]|nr:2-hydroxyacyl-CoA dehydratase [Deltaproteobacteria bacterium]
MGASGTLRYRLARDVSLPLLLAADSARRSVRRALRPKRKPPAWAGPPLQCADRLRTIMTRHYLLARHAAAAMPVAWVTSGAPVELLRAMGFYTVYPENHGALCGARLAGLDMSAPAEHAGFSQDLCSYARIDLGLALGARSPVGTLPRPNVLVCSTNICQTVLYWYKQLAHHYSVPLVLFDTPFVADDLDDGTLAYMVGQLEALIPQLEPIAGRSFVPALFEPILLRAQRTSLMWGEVLRSMTRRPAPMTIFDAFAHMAPVVSLRGLPVAERYYELLLKELESRVSRGIAAVNGERHRLLWDNIAVWFKLGDFIKLFSQAGCVFVAATYTNAWAETVHMLDPKKPLESAARTYSLVILNRDLKHRTALMKSMIKDYSVDGVVFHSTRSCKPYSVGQYDIQRSLSQDCGVRTVLIDADTTDPRNYAEGPTRTRLEAFIEALDLRSPATPSA